MPQPVFGLFERDGGDVHTIDPLEFVVIANQVPTRSTTEIESYLSLCHQPLKEVVEAFEAIVLVERTDHGVTVMAVPLRVPAVVEVLLELRVLVIRVSHCLTPLLGHRRC